MYADFFQGGVLHRRATGKLERGEDKQGSE